MVTKPPFSLFREYVAQLVAYDKKFIIIGNQNAIHYKEIFPLIRDNKLWLGFGFQGNVGFFINTHYEDYAKSSQHKEGMIRVSGVMWYTNLDISKRHEQMILYKNYTPDCYPSYYNYDGIDVAKVEDIPCDFYGNMGVPDTFLTKYNPEQFEIIGTASEVPKTMIHKVVGDEMQYIKDGKCVWATPYTVSERKAGNSLRISDNGLPGRLPYSRIIIRRKK